MAEEIYWLSLPIPTILAFLQKSGKPRAKSTMGFLPLSYVAAADYHKSFKHKKNPRFCYKLFALAKSIKEKHVERFLSIHDYIASSSSSSSLPRPSHHHQSFFNSSETVFIHDLGFSQIKMFLIFYFLFLPISFPLRFVLFHSLVNKYFFRRFYSTLAKFIIENFPYN